MGRRAIPRGRGLENLLLRTEAAGLLGGNIGHGEGKPFTAFSRWFMAM